MLIDQELRNVSPCPDLPINSASRVIILITVIINLVWKLDITFLLSSIYYLCHTIDTAVLILSVTIWNIFATALLLSIIAIIYIYSLYIRCYHLYHSFTINLLDIIIYTKFYHHLIRLFHVCLQYLSRLTCSHLKKMMITMTILILSLLPR